MPRASWAGAGAVACLQVADLEEACERYRRALGFADVRPLGDPPVAALARRGGLEVLLQHVPGVERRPRPVTATWDALLYVDDLAAYADELRARGTQVQVGVGVTHVSDRTLAVRDGCGNVLAFAERPGTPRQALRAAASALVPPRLRARARDLRLGREERAPRRAFEEFQARLPRRGGAFYMFFSAGLLHWVAHAARHVPEDVDLVLLGSDLPTVERAWVREHLGRPFHNIALGVDDNTVWEFLFDTCREDFGWLDVDCFVLEPRLFAEVADLAPGDAVNGVWTYRLPGGQPIACTHLVFCNAGVIRSLRERGRAVGPASLDWRGSSVPLLHPRRHCRVPTRRQREALLELLPPDERGRPAPPGGSPLFDTLVAHQVVATASGYPTRAVRDLAHHTQASLRAGAGAPRWQQDASDEVVHVGGVSYYRRFFHTARERVMYLAAEYVLLGSAWPPLPDGYAERRERCAAELAASGLDPAATVDLVRRHLVDERGLRPATADRILGVGRSARA